MIKRIAIIGGGPGALFVFKKLTQTPFPGISISIFEAASILGSGMPYSNAGANREHVTNVSANEIPEICTSFIDWLKTVSPNLLADYKIDVESFHEFMVIPRLIFGLYLKEQFELLLKQSRENGFDVTVHLNAVVTDVRKQNAITEIIVDGDQVFETDVSIICTGHKWPIQHEGNIEGYYDSPYPPSKLPTLINHPVAIKGSSLTAIDAIKTLARMNGYFEPTESHKLLYHLNKESEGFKIVMHTRNGLLPGIRFHLEDAHLSKKSLLSKAELLQHRTENHGFVSLDYIFDNDFKKVLKEKDPAFYTVIEHLNLESFVERMMGIRGKGDAFEFFKKEYAEADRSIRKNESVYWKELLAILSFAMNQPAKYFSAEDMLRLQKVLMPLISIVIAFVPQQSCEELIALHAAGLLELEPVGYESTIHIDKEKRGIIYEYEDENGRQKKDGFETFIDCSGQPHLAYQDFPFKTLIKNGDIAEARVKFKSAAAANKEITNGNSAVHKEANDFFLTLPGIAITDHFSTVNTEGRTDESLYMMAVPHIGGFNPDYSGLDFCDEASNIIATKILNL